MHTTVNFVRKKEKHLKGIISRITAPTQEKVYLSSQNIPAGIPAHASSQRCSFVGCEIFAGI